MTGIIVLFCFLFVLFYLAFLAISNDIKRWKRLEALGIIESIPDATLISGLYEKSGTVCKIDLYQNQFLFTLRGNTYVLLFESVSDVKTFQDNEYITKYPNEDNADVMGTAIGAMLGGVSGAATGFILGNWIKNKQKKIEHHFLSFELKTGEVLCFEFRKRNLYYARRMIRKYNKKK